MKKLLLSLLAGLLLTSGVAFAQVSGPNYFKLVGTVITPINASWTVSTGGAGGATSTFGFITATTTTATSTFAGNVEVAGNLRVLGNFYAPVSIVSAGSITPSTNNSYTLGTNALKWSQVFSTSLFASSSVITLASSTAVTATTFYSANEIVTNSSTTNSTIATNQWLTYTTLGSVRFTGAGGLTTQNNANFFWDNTNLRLGIATSAPQNSLSVASGSIAVMEYAWGTATSTSMTVDWKRANTQNIRISTSAVTITFLNATTTAGSILKLVVCNPTSGTAGTITWGTQINWSGGTAPTQTTTANKCDVWSFLATNGTSSRVIFGSASTNF